MSDLIEGMRDANGVLIGLPESELSKIMDRLDGKAGPAGKAASDAPSASSGEGWDKMSLLTGGFVLVGSIFWARPPKLRSQQKIMLAIDAADKAAQVEEGNAIQGLVEQSNILCKLASELFFVQEAGNFRAATEDEIGGDEVGLDATEIKDAFFRLMGIDTNAASETPGNA